MANSRCLTHFLKEQNSLFGEFPRKKNNFVPFGEFFYYILKMEESFWTRAQRLIKAHKISQAKFAEYLSLPLPTFSGWIYHNRMPDAATACCIAEALGVTVEYLVRGNDDINAEDRMQRTEERKSAAVQIQKLAQQIGDETERLR